ncbi:flippase [Methanobrevibacter sp. OttesenSCG-928-I08]|nr:flippase [Methanobrevibacter sp. OttesenSCG-928-I08]
MGSKLLRGSFFMLIGNLIFRVGGYLYRFLMASLLGPAKYGILGITLPFQGILQTFSTGGLPPAIAKYVAEYEILDQKDMARQTIYTSLKMITILGLFFGALMVFVIAPWLGEVFLEKPETVLPLQIVGLIVPFSSIVGGIRGAFQGVYKMEYMLYSRAVEQVGMILFATAFVLLGLSVVGAMFGTVLGFIFSLIVSVYIFRNHMGKYIPKPNPDFKFSLNDELKLIKKLLFFSFPVVITSIAEMGIYSVCTIVMGRYLSTELVGYFAAADPIARLPLIISLSISTTILPAASEAFSSKNREKLTTYVTQSYKYSLVVVVPMCVAIALFSTQILEIVYFTNPDYVYGAAALAILSVGMTFYSIYVITSSIIQGIGNPKIPMYILIGGLIITLILNIILVPTHGIVGGSIATTIACLAMIIPGLYLVFRLTKTKAPVKEISKILIASIIMGAIILIILPKSTVGLVIGIIICPIIYLFSLIKLNFFTFDDINKIRPIAAKLGPLSNILNKIINYIAKNIKE